MAKQTKTQKAALITGGAKRIGKATCLALAEMGYAIALHSRKPSAEAQKTANMVRRKGVACKQFFCDLSDKQQTMDLIPKVKKVFADLNVLINCASIFETSAIKDLDLASLENHFAVHFTAPYILTAQFAKKCKKGNIINILDTHIVDNKTSHANYLLSKKALGELTKLAAVELSPYIRVNAVSPGLILPSKGTGSGYLDKLARAVPLKKKGNVDQIAQSIRFLLENPYLTGQIIFNDGGEHLI